MSNIIPVFAGLRVVGDVSLNSGKFLTGDVRPVSPAVQSMAGTYVLDSFNAAQYRSAEYMVQITQESSYSVLRVLVIHDGVSAYFTEYGRIETSGFIDVEFSASLVAGVVHLLYTQSSIETVIKSIGTCLNP